MQNGMRQPWRFFFSIFPQALCVKLPHATTWQKKRSKMRIFTSYSFISFFLLLTLDFFLLLFLLLCLFFLFSGGFFSLLLIKTYNEGMDDWVGFVLPSRYIYISNDGIRSRNEWMKAGSRRQQTDFIEWIIVSRDFYVFLFSISRIYSFISKCEASEGKRESFYGFFSYIHTFFEYVLITKTDRRFLQWNVEEEEEKEREREEY